ncbi:hypothetical protein ACPCIZ_12795 [Streptomyces cellulosae]
MTTTSTAITLAAIAALLEIIGIWITIRDLRKARRRLADYLQRPRRHYLSAAVEATSAASATATGPEPTLEQRVQNLEARLGGLNRELDQRDKRVAERLTRRFQGQLKAAESELGDRLDGLRELVAGEGRTHWFVAYKGPLILAVGVIVGLAGNVVGALPD